MSRRTYQQAVAWRAAAVALLAEVGVEVRSADTGPQGGQQCGNRGTGAQVIEAAEGRAKITTWLTGSISIGGPEADADYLCEPLARHGLLEGWQPGSRGSGVIWIVQPAQPCPSLSSALRTLREMPTEGRVIVQHEPSAIEQACATGLADRLREWRDELVREGGLGGASAIVADEIARRFPEPLA